MKSAIEWAGYKALGSEINLDSFESSFTKGSVKIQRIQITDAEKPTHNSIEINSVRFDLNWDALLRMKFVIEEMASEGIQFQSKRSAPGKVTPPPPPSNEPNFTEKLQGKAIDKLSKDHQNNLLGDIAQFLKSGDINAQVKNIESSLASKKFAEDLNKKWNDKKTEWDTTTKSLPTQKDIQQFKTRFESIQYKNFKTPQEVENSVNQFNSLKSDVDQKVKLVDTAQKNLTTDLKSAQADYQQLDQIIKTDIDNLKNRFKIPKLDAGGFAKSLFMSYLTPYTQKLDHYKKLAQKYLPPKYASMLDGKSKKDSESQIDDTIQPVAREKGVSYEFPITTGYPLFWIKNVKISSQSNSQVDYGDIQGSIKNITSNQRQIGKETTLDIAGDFKSHKLFGIKAFASLNNLKPEPEVRFNFNLKQYTLGKMDLVQSPEGFISLPQATSSLSIVGQSQAFKSYDIKLLNDFKGVQFDVSAKEKIVDDILKQTFSSIQDFDLKASLKGELKDLDMQISSSLGEKLEKSFSSLLQKKVDEVNAQIKGQIDAEIAKYKSQIDSQINSLKGQASKEISNVQSQLDQQKKMADDRIAQAKKDLENQAKSKVQQEGQKAVDDLKKKLGF